MKSLISILALTFSLPLMAQEPLKSKDLKSKICDRVKDELSYRDETIRFDFKACTSSPMFIISTARDPRLNEVTLMNIDYDIQQNMVSLKGKSVLVASFSPDSNGSLVKTWSVKSVSSTISDTRNVIELIKEEIRIGEYNMGNGDLSIENKPGFGLREARKELTQMLENGSCKYATYSGIDSTMTDWAYKEMIRDTKLGTLLKMAKDQGKLKAAVHRIYEDGESEYCSHYYYIFIFSDSTVLYLLIDQTT